MGGIFGTKKEMTYFLPPPADSFAPSRQSNYQNSTHPLSFSPRHTNKCHLLCTFSEALSKRSQKSKHEGTGKASFKKLLMYVTTADIKTENMLFLESFNFKA